HARRLCCFTRSFFDRARRRDAGGPPLITVSPCVENDRDKRRQHADHHRDGGPIIHTVGTGGLRLMFFSTTGTGFQGPTWSAKCPLWVKSRHCSTSAQCPLHPQ